MRIWSLHPKYLDTKGLVALWRETLLAQNVLLGNTKGYKNHPQLNRFKAQKDPVESIGFYLNGIYIEACKRGYNFNKDKIVKNPQNIESITTTTKQMEYEFQHLKNKLITRCPDKYKEIEKSKQSPEPHSLFEVVEGEIEEWEIL